MPASPACEIGLTGKPDSRMYTIQKNHVPVKLTVFRRRLRERPSAPSVCWYSADVRLAPQPCNHHRFSELAASVAPLRWLDRYIRQSEVPPDFNGFWQFWQPLERRIERLQLGRDEWLAARGHLLRLDDDTAELRRRAER